VFSHKRICSKERVVSAAKRITKRQLKDDKFFDAIVEYWEVVRRHQRVIIGGVGALLVLILAISWSANYRKAMAEEASEVFITALAEFDKISVELPKEGFFTLQETFKEIHESYKGETVGKWALYYQALSAERNKQYEVAEKLYDEYLVADSHGEFRLPAKLGIATCKGGVGQAKPQADYLVELARTEAVADALAHEWLFKASRIYLVSGYYEAAEAVLNDLEPVAEMPLKKMVKEDLAALRARQS
jgi:hypothetical protein